MFGLKSGPFEENTDLGIPWLLRELVCQFETMYIFFGLKLILPGLILFSDVKERWKDHFKKSACSGYH